MAAKNTVRPKNLASQIFTEHPGDWAQPNQPIFKTPTAIRNQIARFTGPEYFRMFDVDRSLRDLSTLYEIYPRRRANLIIDILFGDGELQSQQDFTIAAEACIDRGSFAGLRANPYFKQSMMTSRWFTHPQGAKLFRIGYQCGLRFPKGYFMVMISEIPYWFQHNVKFKLGKQIQWMLHSFKLTDDDFKTACQVGRLYDAMFHTVVGQYFGLMREPLTSWLYENGFIRRDLISCHNH